MNAINYSIKGPLSLAKTSFSNAPRIKAAKCANFTIIILIKLVKE